MHLEKLSYAVRLTAHLVATGHPEPTAPVIAARSMAMDLGEVTNAWKASRSRYTARRRYALCLLASMLHAKGWSNAKIAGVLGVHRNHVLRMRKRIETKGVRREGIDGFEIRTTGAKHYRTKKLAA